MKRRDVLIGGALVGLTPVLSEGGAVTYHPAANSEHAELSITDYRARIFGDWATAAAQGEATPELLGAVHADFLGAHSLARHANDRSTQLQAYRVMAWQGVLLTALHTRAGDIQRARQTAEVARQYGYQCGDRAAIASAYDRESIAEIWYGTPELGVKAATRGIALIENETARHFWPILAGLHSQAMVHYARSPNHIPLSEQHERRVLDWQQRLPEPRKPNSFDLAPSQIYNSLAIAHAYRQHEDAGMLFQTSFRATGYTARGRKGFRKLVRLNQAWAEASREPRKALDIATDVMRSFSAQNTVPDPIYRDRAVRVIKALPGAVPERWSLELRHLLFRSV